MADAIQQSPFQYYPSMVSAGGGNAAAFESGYGAAQKEEANRLAMGTEEQQQRERKQIMEMRPQQMDIQQAQNRRAEEELKMRQAEHKYRMGALNSIAGLAGDVLKPSVSLNDSVTAPVTGAGLRAPGPQASYNPEADLPPTRGAPTNVNGYYIPGGVGVGSGVPQFANRANDSRLPVTAQTGWSGPIVPARNPAQFPMTSDVPATQPWQSTATPFQTINPNATAYQAANQRGVREQQVADVVSEIPFTVGSGKYSGVPISPGLFEGARFTEAQLAERGATRAQMQPIIDFYKRPDVQAYLSSDPALAQYVSNDPIQFYQQNAASMAPQAGVATPAATGAPAATSPAGIKTDATVTTGGAAATGAPGKSTLETMLATGGNINLLPTTKDSPLMQPAYINDKTNALRGEMAALAQVRKIAAATRDYSKIPEVALREQAIKVEYDQLQKASSIIKFEAGDYAPLANLLNAESRKQGMNLQLEPITNDKGKTVFNIYNGDKLIDSNVTSKDIVHGSRMVYDKTYKEYVDALNKSATELNTYRLRQLYAGWGEGVKSQLAAEARAYENKHKVTLVPDASRQGVFVKLDDTGKEIGTVTIAPRIRPGKENESDPKKKYELDKRTNEPALFVNEN